MDEREPNDELLARLQFLDAMARQRLPGAEFSILVLVTLGQNVSARELGLTRQGYKRALDALIARNLIWWDGQKPRLHPEACAKFGIVIPEQGDTGNTLLRNLIEGRLERRPVKNLYRLNADGMPASEEELNQLRSQLLDAAVFITARLTREDEAEVRRKYVHHEMSREAEMRALASVVEGFIESRIPDRMPGGLGRAVNEANRSVKAKYPRVLDPHGLLDRFKSALREIDDKRIAL